MKLQPTLKCRYTLIILLFCLPVSVFAKFDFNTNCLKAYGLIFELKLTSARHMVASEKKVNPTNAIVPLLENYIDFFQLLTTDNKDLFNQLKGYKAARLDMIAADDQNSPYYLYAQAEINMQWALIRSRFGEQFNAAMEIKKANSYLQDNAKKFPGFQMNAKGLGVINAVLGILPNGLMKSTLATFGIKGDLQKGIGMMQKLVTALPSSALAHFYEEAVFYYSFVLTDVAHSPIAYIESKKYLARIPDSSLLKSYLKAYVCAKTGHNEEAIEVLSARPTGNLYTSFPYLEYLTGMVRLNKMDLNSGLYFNRFLEQNKGVSYVKDSYLHLGWIALLKGEGKDYATYVEKVKALGYSFNERDKQAFNEVSLGTPNVSLLKARLLSDGGYYSRSQEVLGGLEENELKLVKDRTEYHYRLARNQEELGKLDSALENYQRAVDYGRNLKAHFAANSALLMGKIYMKRKNFTAAKASFNTAIGMKGHLYENSIESAAKDSLKRLN